LKNRKGNRVFLGLGSNRGNRLRYLAEAVQKIDSHNQITIVKQSSIYETSPFGNKDQLDFLNCVVEIHTDLSLIELFTLVKDTEKELGRKENVRWGPREIDIDILLYGDHIVENKFVSIPHKGIKERDFVLAPLIELDEKLKLPGEKILLKEYLNRIQENYILSRGKINLLIYSG
jgi:2-amino-4-hydroxy-6-hydroxymethyldihydropteridine diphosphokinase